jgi:hypothetical protein
MYRKSTTLADLEKSGTEEGKSGAGENERPGSKACQSVPAAPQSKQSIPSFDYCSIKW